MSVPLGVVMVVLMWVGGVELEAAAASLGRRVGGGA